MMIRIRHTLVALFASSRLRAVTSDAARRSHGVPAFVSAPTPSIGQETILSFSASSSSRPFNHRGIARQMPTAFTNIWKGDSTRSSSLRMVSSSPSSSSSSSSPSSEDDYDFSKGDKIQVEVVSFGPLGASVDVIGVGHSPDDMIGETEPALATGLILQKEIGYFRDARGNVDVVVGEVLPAFVEKVRDDGKIDIALRAIGGKAKADSVSKMILERLESSPSGRIDVGDKSPPEAINAEFPGVSKSAFKKAVAMLYKQGIVQPGRDSVSFLRKL